MRYAFIGDIHGNLEAFEAVLREIDALSPAAIYCLGDIVGYGADPGPCLEIIRARAIPSVAGNHDRAVCGLLRTDYFNAEATRSVEWTRAALTVKQVTWLHDLPLTVLGPQCTLAHGSLAAPEEFNYILRLEDALNSFLAHDQPYAFVAHSHVPGIFQLLDEEISFSADAQATFDPNARAIINVGSVGQPRDGNPKASFCLFDPEQRSVEIRRIPYDTDTAARKIVAAGLPTSNALRLFLGR